MITCGYCETQNQDDNQCCIACGGSLVDEISQRRNKFIKELIPRTSLSFVNARDHHNAIIKQAIK